MSFTVTNNNPREDFIFQSKVKGALLQNAGTGGLVEALLQFRSQHRAAMAGGQLGLTHAAFTQYLTDCGAQLSPFEAQYLCAAFTDDAHPGVIDEPTFVRHLCGLNQRRMHAVQQLWDRLDKDEQGCVPADVLMATHRAAAGEATVSASTAGFDQTFQSSTQRWGQSQTGTTACASSTGLADGADTANASNDEARGVSFEEMLAFYAGLSQRIAKDEAFVVHVLREWATDAPSHPTLNETTRTWGPAGDPLATTGPLYVTDALNPALGVSTKSYNYSHMQRVHPARAPLPPLDRHNVMMTTSQERMPAYDKTQMDMADPLVTRRGQLS